MWMSVENKTLKINASPYNYTQEGMKATGLKFL